MLTCQWWRDADGDMLLLLLHVVLWRMIQSARRTVWPARTPAPPLAASTTAVNPATSTKSPTEHATVSFLYQFFIVFCWPLVTSSLHVIVGFMFSFNVCVCVVWSLHWWALFLFFQTAIMANKYGGGMSREVCFRNIAQNCSTKFIIIGG